MSVVTSSPKKGAERFTANPSKGDRVSVAAEQSRGALKKRFMRSLSIGMKLWVTTGILAVPLIGLGIFYVHSLSSTVFFTRAELQGTSMIRPLVALARDVGRHAELEMSSTERGAPAANALIVKIDAELAEYAEIDTKQGNDGTRGKLNELRERWGKLKSTQRSSPQETMSAHDEVLQSALGLVASIGAEWLMILDPELSAYALLDVTLNKMPDAQRYLSEIRVRLMRLSTSGTEQSADLIRVIELAALLGDRFVAAQGEIQSAADSATDRPTLLAHIAAIGDRWDAPAHDWLKQLSQALAERPSPDKYRELLAASDSLPHSLDEAQVKILTAANHALEIRYVSQRQNAVLALAGSAVAMLLAVILMLALARRVSGAINRLLYISQQIGEGNYANRIDETGRDEVSRLYAGVAVMQRRLATQIAAERKQFLETGRIRAALNNVSGSVMVANTSGEIVFSNASMDELLQRSEIEIRKDIANFAASSTLGSSLDRFHRDSASTKSTVDLNAAHTVEIRLGTLLFRLIVNPVLSEQGERIGTVVEWSDRTVEVSMERETEEMLQGVLNGDLARRLDISSRTGFFGILGRGMNQLADNLQQIVGLTKTTADEVQRGADEISQGHIELSQRTEKQSSSLEKTAASMEQMTVSVKQNADNAAQAHHMVLAARDQAQKGGSIVGDAVRAMADISESSKKVASIIGVIDEIAFQTNLLALNAAVEAARAGEQGRAFAVVAAEVRGLAGRAATAANEIKGLIKTSLRTVDDGSLHVSKSGQTLEQIVGAVNDAAEIVAAIASASREQSLGIEEVNRAVTQMDEMTQQNAGLVEQTTAASQGLAQQARQLTEMLERYKTGTSLAETAREPRGRRAGLSKPSVVKIKAGAQSWKN